MFVTPKIVILVKYILFSDYLFVCVWLKFVFNTYIQELI